LHELAIADSMVRIAGRHAAGRRVTKVYLKVGHLRQVVPSALAFSFELVAQGTPLEGAELEMEEVPVTGKCRGCGAESQPAEFPLQCASCGAFDLEVLQGEELYVESLELEGRSAENQELTSGQAEAEGWSVLKARPEGPKRAESEARRAERAD
jgi:hydrogenase nickel incorporation protein HypA/HybF